MAAYAGEINMALIPDDQDDIWMDLQKRLQDMLSRSLQIPASNMISSGYVIEKYKYITPERDEQGTFYGYKILGFDRRKFISPVQHMYWKEDGSATADVVPDEDNDNGIYSKKSLYDRELEMYRLGYGQKFDDCLLVKIAHYGTVIEDETGFRSEKAQIVEVLINGHWTSYQEIYEYTRSNPRIYPPQAYTTRKDTHTGLTWDISSTVADEDSAES